MAKFLITLVVLTGFFAAIDHFTQNGIAMNQFLYLVNSFFAQMFGGRM